MDRLWILVAHGSDARLFRRSGRNSGLELIRRIPFPQGRLQNRELETDRPGRTWASTGETRHAFDPVEQAEAHIQDLHAAELATLLEHERAIGSFDGLVIVAGPKLLGRLQNALDPTTRKHVLGTSAKTLGDWIPDREIEGHLGALLDEIDRKQVFPRTA
jgi:protein required for attachment to host cells